MSYVILVLLHVLHLGMDAGTQCISDHHDEHWDSQTIGTSQLPKEVRVRAITSVMSMESNHLSLISVKELKCLSDKELMKIADILQEVCLVVNYPHP